MAARPIIYAHEPSIVPPTPEPRLDGWTVVRWTTRAPGKRVACKRVWGWSRELHEIRKVWR